MNAYDVMIPVAGDFDGDGKSDLAVFDQTVGTYYVAAPTGAKVINFGNGVARLVPVAGDYDGDGQTDLGAYSLTYGVYYIAPSGGHGFARQFGNATDVMIPEPGTFVPPALQAKAASAPCGLIPLSASAGTSTVTDPAPIPSSAGERLAIAPSGPSPAPDGPITAVSQPAPATAPSRPPTWRISTIRRTARSQSVASRLVLVPPRRHIPTAIVNRLLTRRLGI